MQWIQPDPTGAQYVDGPNLRAFVKSNPINFVDPTGLTAITDTIFPNWMQGSNNVNKDMTRSRPVPDNILKQYYTKTSIEIKYTVIKDDPLYGAPNGGHTYIKINGKGYGYYAASHLGRAAGSSADAKAFIRTTGVVSNDNFDHLPSDPTKVKAGELYLITQEVYIAKCYDKDKFEKALETWAEAQLKAHPAGSATASYSATWYNCFTFVLEGLVTALKASQTGSRVWYIQNEYPKIVVRTIAPPPPPRGPMGDFPNYGGNYA